MLKHSAFQESAREAFDDAISARPCKVAFAVNDGQWFFYMSLVDVFVKN
jgi:hypothetical protein